MTAGQLATLAALGAFHGLNPAMGWLFAVARALQEGRRSALLTTLPAIALGHAAAVAAVATLVGAGRSAGAGTALAVVGGVALVGYGLWRLLSERHFRWAGMRLPWTHVVGWSFLVSSVHGAGLMLLPVLVRTPVPAGHAHGVAAVPGGALAGLAAAGVHTAAMLVVAAALAWMVYEVVGVGVLRRAWFNLDRMWAGVLVAAGVLTLATAL
ncbi:hypothetical protein GCM10010123_25500 [Pilimelia anulata]|uniref:Uncharacterized protein n=1 Tax=Pilimelia anulata TaxID=53371 RepID=A0A8J3BBI9_9ACTN|nr:hypothetical protein [Pilimelia anulata]GGJ94548.1 hypothetical protein GCM10010123_25500 [Pilimelia anulata]